MKNSSDATMKVLKGRAHPVTCIICGKPRRLHGHCCARSVCIHEIQIQIRERVRASDYWPNKALDAGRMTTKAFHTRGKINSCRRRRWRRWGGADGWWSGVGVCECICNCVCAWATNIRFANETIAVFDQFHNWCNPANRYISDQDDQDDGRPGGHCEIEMFWVHSRVNSTHSHRHTHTWFALWTYPTVGL